MKKAVKLLGVMLVLSAVGHAQKKLIPVVFECTCQDQVGELYATAFRDALAKSPRYTETSAAVTKDNNGKPQEYNWQIRVVSVDPAYAVGRQTAISVVILLGDSFYMTHSIQTCPEAQVAGCAADTLARFDEVVNGQ